jgi:hypothetical protein
MQTYAHATRAPPETAPPREDAASGPRPSPVVPWTGADLGPIPARGAVAAASEEPPAEEALEAEAERLAELAMRAPAAPTPPDGTPGQRQTGKASTAPLRRTAGTAGASPALAAPPVRAALRSPGSALDRATRADMEAGFGHDFSQVRVRTGTGADAAARAVDALAFASGHDVVFRSGQFDPATPAGRRLLAHELAHVVQQHGAAPGSSLLRKRGRQAGAKPRGTSFKFSVRITAKLDADQLLLEFVKQYRRVASDAEAERLLVEQHWRWTGTPPSVTDEDVRKGYVLLAVTDQELTPPSAQEQRERSEHFRRLSPEQQTSLHAEVDRQFWEKTNYKVGQQLGTSPDDRAMARYWLVLRSELVRQRRAIDALPPHLKAFLFTEGAPEVEPKDYGAVLRIVGKLSGLSASDLADYKSKVDAETDDWAELERSLDRYIAERARRRQAREELEQRKARLYGLEDLYRTLKAYRSMQSSLRMIPTRDEFGVRDTSREYLEQRLNELEAELISALARADFGGIEDFERAIYDYEAAFQRETAAVAFDLLARYEHVLYEEERRYRDPANALALAQALGRTQAKQQYEEARGHEALASAIQPDAELHRYLPGELEMKQRQQAAGAEARRRAEAEFAKGAAGHPLTQRPTFDRERLAGAAPTEVQGMLLGYIQARREDIAKTRRNLLSNPELVYKLDLLLKASYEAQNIEPNKIYDLIIRDRIRDVRVSEVMVNLALAVLAIAAGLVTLGGGTVAVIAAGVAFGIGTYQAVKEFREYEVKTEAHGAELLSDDPSFAWVIIAIVGAGLDLAGVVGALKAMRPAVQAFNQTHDVVELERSLKAIAEVNEALRANVLKAARAEVQYRKAVKGLLAVGGVRGVLVGLTEEFGRLVVVAYYLAKRGVIAFERFLLELKAQRILAELESLTPEELALLKRAFAEGAAKSRTGLLEYSSLSAQIRGVYSAEEVEQVAVQGRLLGMDDRQITDFLEMGSIQKPWKAKKALRPEEIRAQMETWTKVVKPRGYPLLFESAESFERFEGQLKELIKRYQLPDGRVVVQGSSLRTPAARDVDVAVFVSDDAFSAYAARCRQGVLARVRLPETAQKMLTELQGYVDEGFIPMFYIDRVVDPKLGFDREVAQILAEPFGIPKVDVSVMKSSSSYALYPFLDL